MRALTNAWHAITRETSHTFTDEVSYSIGAHSIHITVVQLNCTLVNVWNYEKNTLVHHTLCILNALVCWYLSSQTIDGELAIPKSCLQAQTITDWLLPRHPFPEVWPSPKNPDIQRQTNPSGELRQVEFCTQSALVEHSSAAHNVMQ